MTTVSVCRCGHTEGAHRPYCYGITRLVSPAEEWYTATCRCTEFVAADGKQVVML